MEIVMTSMEIGSEIGSCQGTKRHSSALLCMAYSVAQATPWRCEMPSQKLWRELCPTKKTRNHPIPDQVAKQRFRPFLPSAGVDEGRLVGFPDSVKGAALGLWTLETDKFKTHLHIFTLLTP
eukprot:5703069-Amphidinium_carterae.1